MKKQIMLGACLTLALVISACSPATPTKSPTHLPTDLPVSTETESVATATEHATLAADTPTVIVPDTSGGIVSIDEMEGLGEVLVDGERMSLYVFMSDTQNGGTSACVADCAVEWPPLLCTGVGTGIDNDNANTNGNTNDNGNANTNTNDNGNSNTNGNDNTNTSGTADDCSSEAMAGEGVDASLLGTVTRDDGSLQVTYNGWPLYLYSLDMAPGDALGQGMNNTWFLVNASGEALTTTTTTPSVTGTP